MLLFLIHSRPNLRHFCGSIPMQTWVVIPIGEKFSIMCLPPFTLVQTEMIGLSKMTGSWRCTSVTGLHPLWIQLVMRAAGLLGCLVLFDNNVMGILPMDIAYYQTHCISLKSSMSVFASCILIVLSTFSWSCISKCTYQRYYPDRSGAVIKPW